MTHYCCLFFKQSSPSATFTLNHHKLAAFKPLTVKIDVCKLSCKLSCKQARPFPAFVMSADFANPSTMAAHHAEGLKGPSVDASSWVKPKMIKHARHHQDHKQAAAYYRHGFLFTSVEFKQYLGAELKDPIYFQRVNPLPPTPASRAVGVVWVGHDFLSDAQKSLSQLEIDLYSSQIYCRITGTIDTKYLIQDNMQFPYNNGLERQVYETYRIKPHLDYQPIHGIGDIKRGVRGAHKAGNDTVHNLEVLFHQAIDPRICYICAHYEPQLVDVIYESASRHSWDSLLDVQPDQVLACVDTEFISRKGIKDNVGRPVSQGVLTEWSASYVYTNELRAVPPGKNFCNWMALIKTRHFEFEETQAFNRDGGAGGTGFLYGKAEVVKREDMKAMFLKMMKDWSYEAARRVPLTKPASTHTEGLKGPSVGSLAGALPSTAMTSTIVPAPSERKDTTSSFLDHDSTDAIIRNTCPHNLRSKDCSSYQRQHHCGDKYHLCEDYALGRPCPYVGICHDGLYHIRANCSTVLRYQNCVRTPEQGPCPRGHDFLEARRAAEQTRREEATINTAKNETLADTERAKKRQRKKARKDEKKAQEQAA